MLKKQLEKELKKAQKKIKKLEQSKANKELIWKDIDYKYPPRHSRNLLFRYSKYPEDIFGGRIAKEYCMLHSIYVVKDADNDNGGHLVDQYTRSK